MTNVHFQNIQVGLDQQAKVWLRAPVTQTQFGEEIHRILIVNLNDLKLIYDRDVKNIPEGHANLLQDYEIKSYTLFHMSQTGDVMYETAFSNDRFFLDHSELDRIIEIATFNFLL